MIQKACSILLLLLALSSPAMGSALVTDTIESPQSALSAMYWLPDPYSRLSVEEASSPGRRGDYIPLEGKLPIGAVGAGWLRLDLARSQPDSNGVPITSDIPLVLHIGQLPSGTTKFYYPEDKGAITWLSVSEVHSFEALPLPEPALAGASLYFQMEETPSPWFAPIIARGVDSKPTIPPDLLLPGLLLAALAVCLLRSAKNRVFWSFWAACILAAALVQSLLPLPLSRNLITYPDLLPLLAPGLCLMLYPHLGRLMLHTYRYSPGWDTLLRILYLVGVVVCLAPLLPGFFWLTRLFPLWGLLLLPLLPLAGGALTRNQPGALAYFGAVLMPIIGSALGLAGLFYPGISPMAQTSGLWGLAVGGIALTLARVGKAPNRRTAKKGASPLTDDSAEAMDFEDFPASAPEPAIKNAFSQIPECIAEGYGDLTIPEIPPLEGQTSGSPFPSSFGDSTFTNAAFDASSPETSGGVPESTAISPQASPASDPVVSPAVSLDISPVAPQAEPVPHPAAQAPAPASFTPVGSASSYQSRSFADLFYDDDISPGGVSPQPAPKQAEPLPVQTPTDADGENISRSAGASQESSGPAQETTLSLAPATTFGSFEGLIAAEEAPQPSPAAVEQPADSSLAQGPEALAENAQKPAATSMAFTSWSSEDMADAAHLRPATQPEEIPVSSAAVESTIHTQAATPEVEHVPAPTQAQPAPLETPAFAEPAPIQEEQEPVELTSVATSASVLPVGEGVEAALANRNQAAQDQEKATRVITIEDDDPLPFDTYDDMDTERLPRSTAPAGGSYIFNLHNLIREVHHSVAPLAKDKGILLSWFTAPTLPPLLVGDVPNLRQSLTLLLQNAVMATMAGSVQLYVRHTPSPDTVGIGNILFSVSDSGTGMRSDSGYFHAWELAERTGGNFSIEYAPKGGTQINFSVSFALPTEEMVREYDQALQSGVGMLPVAAPAVEVPAFPLTDKMLSEMASRSEPTQEADLAAITVVPAAVEASAQYQAAPLAEGIGSASSTGGFNPLHGVEAAMAALRLPAEEAANLQPLAPAQDPLLQALPETNGRCVLITDMTTSNKRLLSNYFSSLSVPCLEAKTSNQALEIFNKTRAALVIFDGDSPEDATIAVLSSLQQAQKPGENIARLLIASHEGQAEKLLGKGVTHTLMKPFSKENLLEVAQRAAPVLFAGTPAQAKPTPAVSVTPTSPAAPAVTVAAASAPVMVGSAKKSAPVQAPPAEQPNTPSLPQWADVASPEPKAQPASSPALAQPMDNARAEKAADSSLDAILSQLNTPEEPTFASPSTQSSAQAEVQAEALVQANVQNASASGPSAQEPDSRTQAASTPSGPAVAAEPTEPADMTAAPLLHSLSQEDVAPAEGSILDFIITEDEETPEQETAESPAAEEPPAAKPEVVPAVVAVVPSATSAASESDLAASQAPLKQEVPSVSIHIPSASAQVAPTKVPQASPVATDIVEPPAGKGKHETPVDSLPEEVEGSPAAPGVSPFVELSTAEAKAEEQHAASRQAAPQAQAFSPQPEENTPQEEPRLPPLPEEDGLSLDDDANFAGTVLLPGLDGEMIENVMLPLIPGLLHTLTDTLGDAIKGRDERQTLFVQEAVSRLISKAEIFGLERLSKIAQCVERAADADDFEAVATLLEDLINVTQRYVTSLGECYETYMKNTKPL